MSAARPMTGQRGMAPLPTAGMGRQGPVAVLGGPKGNPFAPSIAPSAFNAPPGMRPPTNAGNRPGSSAGVPQGMRPPTSGGAAAGGVGAPVPLNTDIQVTVRPVTGMAAGLNGMPTGRVGDGRKIADKSYYLTELNRKLNDIIRELDVLQSEGETIGSDNSLYTQLERRYELHMKDVRLLEGQLADFNLAFDKLRTNTHVDEIRDMFHHLKQRNEQEKNMVDGVFLKVAQQEQQTRELEAKMHQMHLSASERIASLGEEKQQEYLDLQDELTALNERITEREENLQTIARDCDSYEDTLKSDAYIFYSKCQQLQRENTILNKQRLDLEEELNSTESPQELKEKMTQKIKDITQEMNDLETKSKKLEQVIEKLNDQVRTRENDLQAQKQHTQKSAKYDAIYERDAKMSEFITSFPEQRKSEQQEKQKIQQTILALMKHISKGMNHTKNIQEGGSGGDGGGDGTTQSEKFSDLKSELTFKEEKMQDSAKTLATLQVELTKRREELAKIDTLDTKIGGEISQLKEKIESMQKEMNEYKSEDEIKTESVQQKKDLLTETQRVKKQKDAMKQQVTLLSNEVERKKKDLHADEIYKKLDAYETKLKTHSSAVFTLQEYVTQKKRESDYEAMLKDCSQVTKQINEILVKNMREVNEGTGLRQ